MIGALLNFATVIIGGGIGLLFKKAVPERLEKPIMIAEGIAVLIICLNGILTRMISVGEDGKLTSSGELLVLISLVVGTVIGELLDLDGLINRFARGVEHKINKPGFAEGFVSATLIFCVGAMLIIGPIAEVTEGDITITALKSVLDGVTALTLAVTLGYGVVFAAVPVLVLEGGVALFAKLLVNLPEVYITDICTVGFCVCMCISFNFICGTKIKSANMVPAILVPVLYNLLRQL